MYSRPLKTSTPTPKNKYIYWGEGYNITQDQKVRREYSKDNNPINKAREEEKEGGKVVLHYTPLSTRSIPHRLLKGTK